MNQRGAARPGSKLTERQVLEIRRRFADGQTLYELHRAFPQCSKPNLHHIVNGRRWRYLLPEPNGWQPIETAPKDGSNILIIAAGAYSPQPRVGWWDGGWRFYSRPSKPSGGGVTVMIEASHWMPLSALGLPA